jgi:hypothetical protein
MKKLIALALLSAFGAAAQAKPTPVELQSPTIISDEATISTGPAGATLEQDYFRAPQPAYAGGRIFPCRLQLHIFDKTRLAQWCN